MEVWAKEVLARKQQQQQSQVATNSAGVTEARKERASAFAQDFVSGLSAFGKSALFHARKSKLLTKPQSLR